VVRYWDKKMGIKDHDNRLLDYVYDELEASERELFERQLAEDAALRAELARVQSTRTMMNQVVDEEPPQELFYELVREARKAVAEQHQPSFFQRFSAALLRPQAATALVVWVVAVTGVYLLDNTQSRMPDDPRDVVSPTTLPSRSEVVAAHAPTAAMDEKASPGVAESKKATEASPADDLVSFGAGVLEAALEPASKADGTVNTDVVGNAGIASKDNATKRPSKRRAKKVAKARRSRAKQAPAPAREQQNLVAPRTVQPMAQGNQTGLGVLNAKRSVLAKKSVVQKEGYSGQAVMNRMDRSSGASSASAPSAAPSADDSEMQEPLEVDEAAVVKPEPYEAAMSDYRAQRYGQAIRGFNRVLVDKKWSNRVYSARLHLARAYKKQKKTARALEQYRSVLQAKQSVSQRRMILLETARLEMQIGLLGAARTHILEASRGQKKLSPAANALLKKVEERIRRAQVQKEKKKKQATESKKAKPSK